MKHNTQKNLITSTLVLVILIILVVLGVSIRNFLTQEAAQNAVAPTSIEQPVQKSASTTQTTQAFDPKNSTFTIDGQSVTLINGISEVSAAPGSASKITTKYFGNEAYGDLNGDGRSDMAYLISQNSGGSGTFYYVVVALQNKDGYKTTNAFLVGDRISPQPTEIHSDSKELYVNFAERKAGEPMSAQPSVGATLLLKITPQGVLEGLMK
mgnify:CR=1 FL=1